MSDETMVTERAAVERERAAWAAGRYLGADYPRTPFALSYSACEQEARRRYPLPTVTRPRVVPDPHIPGVSWSVSDADHDPLVMSRDQVAPFSFGHSSYTPSPERVTLWADLYARSTEECEE